MRFRRHQEAAQAGTRRLVLLFVAVVAALVVAVNAALAAAYLLTVPWAGGFPRLFFETNTAVVLLLVGGGCWLETLRLGGGGPHVARLAGGREAGVGAADARLERRLANVVAEMSIAANTPPPAAWVLPREDAINAFAAGWGSGDAVVAVSRGALERLDRAELQGVVAHEISHLVHGDTRLNMRLIGLVWGLRMVFDLGRALAAPDDAGRRHAGVLFGLALMAVGSLGWLAGRLLQAAVSRQREYLADASAVKYTRQVIGIGGALRKIAHQQRHGEDRLRSTAGSLGHLYLARPAEGWLDLSSHPPLAERLQRLYGRPVEPLGAPVLPPPDADELLGTVALAPHAAPGLPAGLPAKPRAAPLTNPLTNPLPSPPADPPADPLADPLARARTQADAAAVAEALARIGRWHGPREVRQGLAALIAAPGTAAGPRGAPVRHARLDGDGAAAPPAAAAEAVVRALPRALHLPVCEALAERAARWPAAERRALIAALWPALPATPAGQLAGLALRHAVRHGGRHRPLGWDARASARTVVRHADAVASATAALARALALPAPLATPWAAAVAGALPPAAAAPPGGGPARAGAARGAGAPGPAAPPAAWRAIVRLQRLAALQRPLPVRAWVNAWVQQVPAAERTPALAEALRHACRLLDVPLPPALAACFVEPDRRDDTWRLPGVDAAAAAAWPAGPPGPADQLRSL